jgi:NitT/TauT family transport system substrate-binding protein
MRCPTRILAGLALAIASLAPAHAEAIKIGVSKLASCSPIAIAMAKGYFKAEGLEPDLVFFDAQQPIAVAAVSGDVDFGIAAETAALYSLSGSGKLKVIGGGASEAPTFHYLSILAAKSAWEAGLKSPKDLAGHSVALTQMGTGLQYSMGLLAEKFGFDIKTIKFLPLQSNANIASALAGGRVDASIFSAQGALPLIERGDVKLLGWIGDETGLDQAYLLFVAAEVADKRPEAVKHFLAAYRKGAHDFYAAFTDQDGKRKDGPTAPAVLAILTDYLHQPVELVERGIPYFDPDGKVDSKGVQHQIDWYRSQGLIKEQVSAAQIIDKRYALER